MDVVVGNMLFRELWLSPLRRSAKECPAGVISNLAEDWIALIILMIVRSNGM
jgi:hypothetical protein